MLFVFLLPSQVWKDGSKSQIPTQSSYEFWKTRSCFLSAFCCLIWERITGVARTGKNLKLNFWWWGWAISWQQCWSNLLLFCSMVISWWSPIHSPRLTLALALRATYLLSFLKIVLETAKILAVKQLGATYVRENKILHNPSWFFLSLLFCRTLERFCVVIYEWVSTFSLAFGLSGLRQRGILAQWFEHLYVQRSAGSIPSLSNLRGIKGEAMGRCKAGEGNPQNLWQKNSRAEWTNP